MLHAMNDQKLGRLLRHMTDLNHPGMERLFPFGISAAC
jgi:hypothetical protein